MSEVIECVYEDGVLKPFEKIDLKEKTKVMVTIKPKLNLGDFIMAKLPEEKIRELEERFESEDIY
jgi:predicted DNA-binding antitoxin AbrB/MazE fold protein